MKKQVKGRKFSRKRDQRKALIKSLARSLFVNEKIKTTEAKAKELRVFSEKLITKARKGDLTSRRHLARYFEKDLVKKIVEEIAPKYKKRPGGYTRIIKLEPRISYGVKRVIIELVK